MKKFLSDTRKDDPSDAKVNTFSCIWGDTMAYEFGPLLIFLIVFFHPDLVPKKTKVLARKEAIHKVYWIVIPTGDDSSKSS